MSYLVLARKYRPQQFAEVVGQAHVAQTLQNALAAGKVAHAYLFSGPRGVGKTTTARILAKALNCAKGPAATPCDACDQCTEISRGVEVIDVFEIDAASNRGIDEIRELRETVKYAPARGRYKVYIIDEAHQITHDAFNALLKTLEEPPPHVVFILATTEGNRIPPTILSRCQRFRFRPVPHEELIQQLRRIVKAEGFQVEDPALERIAEVATGSLRDAISLLDQVVSFAPEGVTAQDVAQLLGVLPEELLQRFAEVLARQDPQAVLAVLAEVVGDGWDLTQFVRDAREYFRRQLVTAVTQPPASSWSVPQLLRVLRALSQCLEEMRWQDAQRAVLELHALRLTQPFVEIGEVMQRIEQFEARLTRLAAVEAPAARGSLRPGRPVPSPATRSAGSGQASLGIDSVERSAPLPAPPSQEAPPTAPQPVVSSPLEEAVDRPHDLDAAGDPPSGNWLGWVRERWDKIRHELWKRPGVASVFDTATLQAATADDLSIAFRETFHVEQVKRNQAFVEETIARVTGRRFRIQCQQGHVPEPQEPFVVVAEENSFQETIVKADEGVRKVLQHFPGTVRPKSTATETSP